MIQLKLVNTLIFFLIFKSVNFASIYQLLSLHFIHSLS